MVDNGRMSAVALSTEEVARLGQLARIDLSPEELAQLATQLDVILNAVARVGEVADDEVPPTSHPSPLSNVFRVDKVRLSLSNAEALAGAPAVEDERFRVPRILDEEA